MNRFVGKVALVTGGRSGIGRAIAERLREEGARVFTAQRGEDTEFESIKADFSDTESAAKVIQEIVDRAGQLDVLVNNAGMMQEITIEDTTLEDWQRNLTVNLTTPFLLIQAALPHLKATRGTIVNTGSTEGITNNPLHTAYGTTKAGLHGLTRTVAIDVGDDGVRCNAVAPGWIDTDLNNDFIESMDDPVAFRAGLGKIHPVGRTGSPKEVAALAAFLAAEESGFITGHVYFVDGGRTIQLSLP